jgi:hypothetical protein
LGVIAPVLVVVLVVVALGPDTRAACQWELQQTSVSPFST